MNGRRNKPDKRRKPERDPGQEYIRRICALYNDLYDDREEDSRPGGESWVPGHKALHTSLESFRRELRDVYGIALSTAKIRKILITGGLWTTERSREVAELYEKYKNVKAVAETLDVSPALVTMYLPYEKVVYSQDETYRPILELGRLAPSSFNRQPCVFVTDDRKRIHLFRKQGLIANPITEFAQCVDAGAALAHLELGAQAQGFHTEIQRLYPAPRFKFGLTYQATVVLK